MHLRANDYSPLLYHGHFIIQNSPKEKITLADIKEIEPLLLKELDASFFDARYGKVPESEQNVLMAIARAGKEVSYSTIETLSGYSSSSLVKLLSRLEKKGLVYTPKRGLYEFTIPLFESYLMRL